MKRETFAQARARLLAGLEAAGWAVKNGLKVPRATSDDGVSLWFHAQAVYRGTGGSALGSHSICSDMRDVTVERLLQLAGG